MTPAELRRVLETARRYHVDVIPLIQSLGHLEYCLKHEELRGLRELPDVHTQACPTNPDALRFVTDMMDEVMAYHPDAELFHLGGDETGWLGRCPRCRKAARKKGNVGLYLDHIVPVLEHVLRRGRRPILWDDIVRTEPEKAGRIPRETVLGYWDYGPTREEHRDRRLPPILARFYRTQGRRAALWPDTLSFFPYFDFYQSKGFEVLAAPCLNYGTIVPDYVHSGRNTIKFAEKALACDGLGTINTQWACFRLPLGVSWYGYALTALCTWSAPPADTADFDVAFSRLFMGTDTAVLSEACAMVAEGVGFRVPGARRPFNLLHYAIMDAELHYPDGMRGRQKYGSNERAMQPDFARIVRRKLSLLRRHERRPDVLARMEWVASQMEAALHLLDCARPKTARGRRALEILRASGEFKLTRLHTMRLLMGERSKFKDARGALGAEQRCRKALENAYAHEVHPRQLPFEMDLLFDGEMRVLQGT
jgi:hypothetical protein